MRAKVSVSVNIKINDWVSFGVPVGVVGRIMVRAISRFIGIA